MRINKPLILALLSLVGLAASIPPLLELLGESQSYCTTDCSALYYSPYARIGPIHFSQAAPVYFTALLLVAVLWLKGYQSASRLAPWIVGLGVAFIPYLVYVEFVLVGVICIYCTIMHVSILASGAILAYS